MLKNVKGDSTAKSQIAYGLTGRYQVVFNKKLNKFRLFHYFTTLG
jgi:hypothetical protein